MIAVSEFLKKEISAKTGKDDIRVLRNSVDEKIFYKDLQKRLQMRQSLGLSDDEVAVCYSGRIVKPKGVMQLIQAFAELGGEAKCKLFLFGSLGGLFKNTENDKPEFAAELMRIAEPLKDKVVFTGFVDNDKLPDYLNAMDIAVMPSIYPETCALNNVEYQSVGLPVITTDSGGIKEFVNDGAVILDHRKDLVSQLRDALISLIASPEKRSSMSEASLSYASCFTRRNYYKSFLEILK